RFRATFMKKFLGFLTLARTMRRDSQCATSGCDITNRAQLVEALRAIRAAFGDPEVLLYNAGVATLGSITEITRARAQPAARPRRGRASRTHSGRSGLIGHLIGSTVA